MTLTVETFFEHSATPVREARLTVASVAVTSEGLVRSVDIAPLVHAPTEVSERSEPTGRRQDLNREVDTAIEIEPLKDDLARIGTLRILARVLAKNRTLFPLESATQAELVEHGEPTIRPEMLMPKINRNAFSSRKDRTEGKVTDIDLDSSSGLFASSN